MFDPCKIEAPADFAQRDVTAALLLDNDIYDRHGLFLELFTEPTCRRSFAVAESLITKGELANDVTVGMQLSESERNALADMLEERGDPATIEAYVAVLREGYEKRQAIVIAEELKLGASLTGEKPRDIINAAIERLDEICNGRTSSTSTRIDAAMEKAADAALEAYKTGIVTGLRLGIPSLDEKLGPLQGGQLGTVGGGTGQGKSAFGGTVLDYITRQGIPAILFALEMTQKQIAERYLAAETNIEATRIASASFTAEEAYRLAAASKAYKGRPLFIEYLRRPNASLIHRILRRYIRKHGVRIAVIDYLGLMKAKGSSKYEQISEITADLKGTAVDLDVPILLLAQLNRENQKRADGGNYRERYLKRRPKISDIRDSGSIEADSDFVLLLHREETYLLKEEPSLNDASAYSEWSDALAEHAGRADIIIGKQRQGGDAIVKVRFDAKRFRFEGGANG